MMDVTMKLHQIAHGRTGDKGNRLNVSVIAYHSDAFPLLCQQVTPERVFSLFTHRGATRICRYELPHLHALNFVIDDALQGGVNAALMLDAHGKTNVFRVLALDIAVPRALVERIAVKI